MRVTGTGDRLIRLLSACRALIADVSNSDLFLSPDFFQMMIVLPKSVCLPCVCSKQEASNEKQPSFDGWIHSSSSRQNDRNNDNRHRPHNRHSYTDHDTIRIRMLKRRRQQISNRLPLATANKSLLLIISNLGQQRAAVAYYLFCLCRRTRAIRIRAIISFLDWSLG